MSDERENWEAGDPQGPAHGADERAAERAMEEPVPGQQLAVRKAELATGDRGYIVPTDVEAAMRMAKAVVVGKLAPSSYNNDPNMIVLGIMSAMEAGLPPLYGLRQIAIINGRPTIWGDGAVALVQSKNLIAGIETKKVGTAPETNNLAEWPDDYGVEVTIKRRNQEGAYTGVFTVGMAKRSKLWLNTKKVPWMEYPERMMFNRARAFALRDGFADALGGIAIREEVEDMTDVERAKPIEVNLSDEPVVAAPPLPTKENEDVAL